MKKLLLLLVFLVTATFSFGQENPVEITTEIKKISDTEYDLVFRFEIEEEWHFYSQYNPEGASAPLRITISEDEQGYMLVGDAVESETHTAYSDEWGVDEIFFSEEGEVTQRVQVFDMELEQISINFKGQVCNESCLPVDEDFTFALDGGEVVVDNTIDEKSAEITKSLTLNLKNKELLHNSEIHGEVAEDGTVKKDTNLLTVFFLGFAGGLLAFLTPCVFPLVPLTVSFFTKQSAKGNKSKGVFNAIMYGVFILVIYLLLSSPFHFLDSLDPEILTTISTNVWLNLFFFIILVFFAGSFFGFYEITLPSSWGNKMDSASGIGGIIGIFFMALTLAIVSFSCTGPILGSLLAGSLNGGAWPLTAGMGGFGLALALPFALFALFPSLLNSLPKSGGWMTTIKILLGFIEVALAFKFLSSADLVGHWNLFYREIFIAIWLVILTISILFLFGILRFPGNRKVRRVAGIRILLGILAVSAFVYLAPGLMKNPIWPQSLLSGLAPPEYHTIYDKGNEYCPLNLTCFKDFDEGMAYAKKENKPVLLDFTGWACVNCRKMEETVWREPTIYSMLKKDIVLISLYVDDNEKRLPVEEQFDYIKPNGKKKRIKTYGGKWATMQAENFKTASQPYYVLMSPELEILNAPQQYTDTKEYYDWLKEGVDKFGGVSSDDEGENTDEDEYEEEETDDEDDEDEYEEDEETDDEEEYEDDEEEDSDEEYEDE